MTSADKKPFTPELGWKLMGTQKKASHVECSLPSQVNAVLKCSVESTMSTMLYSISTLPRYLLECSCHSSLSWLNLPLWYMYLFYACIQLFLFPTLVFMNSEAHLIDMCLVHSCMLELCRNKI